MRYQLIQYSIFIYEETHGDSVNEMGLVFFSKASAGYDWTYHDISKIWIWSSMKRATVAGYGIEELV